MTDRPVLPAAGGGRGPAAAGSRGRVRGAPVAPQGPARRDVVRSGAELVALAERFHLALFAGATAFVAAASLAALAFLPLRHSAVDGRPPASALVAGLTVLLLAAATLARAAAVYRALRARPALELVPVAVSALLLSVASPLRNELWWPACAILMVLATLVPLQRALLYVLVVLLANLAAHAIADDFATTSTVGILGLWIGLPFWSALAAVVPDRLAGHIMRLNAERAAPGRPLRAEAWSAAAAEGPAADVGRPEDGDGEEDADGPRPREGSAAPDVLAGRDGEAARRGAGAPGDGMAPDGGERPTADPVLARLTARQLQVVALLADGLRYAEVAACLSISPAQVQRHVAGAVARLDVRSVNELVAVAVAHGLAPAAGAPAAVGRDVPVGAADDGAPGVPPTDGGA